MTFGEFVKKKRMEAGLSLREFCRMTGLDPSNWSKVERGVFPPPKSSRTVRDIAAALILSVDSDDWHMLHDLAAIGHIPSELAPGGQESEKLAIFFRMARDKKPTREDVKEMLKLLK